MKGFNRKLLALFLAAIITLTSSVIAMPGVVFAKDETAKSIIETNEEILNEDTLSGIISEEIPIEDNFDGDLHQNISDQHESAEVKEHQENIVGETAEETVIAETVPEKKSEDEIVDDEVVSEEDEAENDEKEESSSASGIWSYEVTPDNVSVGRF